MHITKTSFGHLSNGEEIFLFRLENKSGAYVTITNFGCRIVSIYVPDRDGQLTDVTLGYDTIEAYENDANSFGAVVGRHANRIGKGTFTLNGKTYHLAINNGPNHLHGGLKGFHYYPFQAEIKGDELHLSRRSPDGEEGYPGNLDFTVIYSFDDENTLSITYHALSDADTVFNVTNHAYFNLEGHDHPSVLDHELHIEADAYTETDDNDLTTGVISDVTDTPFDFRQPKTIGTDIFSDHYQVAHAKTYDHNFVIRGEGLRRAATLKAPVSGIHMTCLTDQPGMQIYVPAGDTSDHGKGGLHYPAYGSVCLETQHFPNAMEHENFPSVVLKANVPFESKTVYQFSTK